ncbi:MAG: hypothetical protein KGM42_14580 [Hyphomicrobiales bacterium]|nr:hypothetical protein [Hyphomicrobiales bacterium]
MVVDDIVNSCTNSNVAEAAVVSIGGAFARRVREEASRKGVRPGAWAAAAVMRYRKRARELDYAELQSRIAGDDQPVLAGFRMIVEPELVCAGEGAGR